MCAGTERASTRSDDLAGFYQAYIACLNDRDRPALSPFSYDEAYHDGRPLGAAGYRAMLEKDVGDLPDLRFRIDLLVCDPPHVAARLAFDCTPAGSFLGLPIEGRRIAFAETVFSAIREGKIRQVWSVIDKAAIEAQSPGRQNTAG